MTEEHPGVVTNPDEVEAIAAAIASVGEFCIDLEFQADARFTPELSLVQVNWASSDGRGPGPKVIDALAVDATPIAELVADPAIMTILHAGFGDLSLLHATFGVEAANVIDTQIGAAMAGIGDQVGYARLVHARLGIELDKSSQFTNWLARPLKPKLLRYAAGDVLHLQELFGDLRQELVDLDRFDWVVDETQRLARRAASIIEPREMWKTMKGVKKLDPPGRAALQHLAAWRVQRAKESNKPLSWIVDDSALIELARTRPSRQSMASIPGIGPRTVRRYGEIFEELLEQAAASEAPVLERGPRPVSKATFSRARDLCRQRASELHLPAPLLAPRSELEAYLAYLGDSVRQGTTSTLSQGWRSEAVGRDLEVWMRAGATGPLRTFGGV